MKNDIFAFVVFCCVSWQTWAVLWFGAPWPLSLRAQSLGAGGSGKRRRAGEKHLGARVWAFPGQPGPGGCPFRIPLPCRHWQRGPAQPPRYATRTRRSRPPTPPRPSIRTTATAMRACDNAGLQSAVSGRAAARAAAASPLAGRRRHALGLRATLGAQPFAPSCCSRGRPGTRPR